MLFSSVDLAVLLLVHVPHVLPHGRSEIRFILDIRGPTDHPLDEVNKLVSAFAEDLTFIPLGPITTRALKAL